MKSLKLFGKSVIKLGKGFIVIHAILFAFVFIVQSCKKEEVVREDGAADKFLSAVKQHGESIRAVAVKPADTRLLRSHHDAVLPENSSSNNSNTMAESSQDEQLAYITFSDDMPANPDFTYDINGMAHLITDYNGVLSYQPSDSSFSFVVPLNEVSNTLNPLVSEAKLYLNARGLTNADIDAMIQEEGAQEVDLVPYATALAEYENSGQGSTGMNYLNVIATSAHAEDVLHCAMVALGVDALWALGGSNAASWSKGAMKSAFKAVAKRAMGPIGVAIAVVSFGLCMGGWD